MPPDTVSGLLVLGRELLKSNPAAAPAQESRELLAFLLGVDRRRLPLMLSSPVPEEAAARFRELCRRRAEGYPLQYLLGSWTFRGLEFAVGEGVLIPREDTETVAEVCLEKLKGLQNLVAADLCSGSGCIAVALERSVPGLAIWAVEVSGAAFAYLQKNAAANGCRNLAPVQADIRSWEPPCPLDLIVSNPPYLTGNDMDHLQREVRWEPPLALFGGRDGLDFYRAILGRYPSRLKPGGWLVLEVGMGQDAAVRTLMEKAGLIRLGSRRDLGGIVRCLWGQKPLQGAPSLPVM